MRCANSRSAKSVIAAGDAATAGCIVLDYNLPGMTGLDLIRQLRAEGVQTPAIMVSGNGKQLVASRRQGRRRRGAAQAAVRRSPGTVAGADIFAASA